MITRIRDIGIGLVTLAAWIACITFAIAAIGLMGGCEPKVRSPVSGELVTEAQLDAEVTRERERARVADEREAAEAQARIAKAEAAAKLEARRTEAQSAITLAEIQARFESESGQALREYQASSSERAASIAALEDSTAVAKAELEKQRRVVAGLWGIAKPFVAAAPGGQQAVGAIELVLGASTLAAGVGLVRERRRRADQASEAEANSAAAKSIVNAIDLLRARNPAVADAMKSAKADILGQLTDRARQIVESERLT